MRIEDPWVDQRIPDNVRDLPRNAEIRSRFLIHHSKGWGPGAILGMMDLIELLPSVPTLRMRDPLLPAVFQKIYEEKGSDPTSAFNEIFESILKRPQQSNETELRVVEELLEWMKTEVPAGLSAFGEATERSLQFSPEPSRRRHESGGYSPSTFRHPSGRPRSEHSSPQQVHASTALTAPALSALLIPALQQALPSLQINLDPQ